MRNAICFIPFKKDFGKMCVIKNWPNRQALKLVKILLCFKRGSRLPFIFNLYIYLKEGYFKVVGLDHGYKLKFH